ncbi:MAG: hypothetical protein KGZ75_09315 [Syntrophomonadaceae bacterium]|nr:hypothetical protein [Syntrophomonadaceae bacterium]
MLKIPKSLAHQVVFVDTSAFVTLIDPSGPEHKFSKEIFWELAKQRWRLITTNFVIADTYNWIIAEMGLELARTWLKVAHQLNVERITLEDEVLAAEILQGKPIEGSICYTIAVNIAVMQRLGIEQVFSFEQVYKDYGFSLYKDLPGLLFSVKVAN